MSRTDELDLAFRAARMFDPRELRGEYTVRMLTRLPSLHRIGHRKLFRQGPAGIEGVNLFFRSLAWASFFVEEGLSPDPERLPVVVINYGLPANLLPWRGVRDHIRATGPGRYLGRLNLLVGGRLRFLAYFSLTKIEAAV